MLNTNRAIDSSAMGKRLIRVTLNNLNKIGVDNDLGVEELRRGFEKR